MDMAERGGDCHSEQLPPSSDAEIDRCQPVCLPVYGLKGHHERASTPSLGGT
ncbi:TPA: hypothetical protein ACH3X2_000553 [Trebouxia sp. C0005]